MRKLMVLAAMAAMVLGAMAEYSIDDGYTIGNCYFTPVNKQDSGAWYKGYIIYYPGGADAAYNYVANALQESVAEKAVARYLYDAGTSPSSGLFVFEGDQGHSVQGVDPSKLKTPFADTYAVVYYSNPWSKDYKFELISTDVDRTDYLFDTGHVVGNGWTDAIPEPTSGLLMLLGMAGLVLKRKRA